MRILLIALFALSGAARAVTLDELLAKNLAARGGAANVQKLKTLRLTGRAVFSDVVPFDATCVLEDETSTELEEVVEGVVLRLSASRTTCANAGSPCAPAGALWAFVDEEAAGGIPAEARLEMANVCMASPEGLADRGASSRPHG